MIEVQGWNSGNMHAWELKIILPPSSERLAVKKGGREESFFLLTIYYSWDLAREAICLEKFMVNKLVLL